jgi:hypothetical protein
LEGKGSSPEAAFRNVLGAIRQELGREIYLLACWGVLPETAGIADGTRLGTDGFGPSTLTQYNSWNNVVWRNDPDHVDIAGQGEDIIRPVLVSMAGAQMLLTDKLEFYRDGSRLEGARRAAPILFSLPGQLYDFDPTKTNNLVAGLRNASGGTYSGPLDADQGGVECPWWLIDINRPFGSWSVLAPADRFHEPSHHAGRSGLGRRAVVGSRPPTKRQKRCNCGRSLHHHPARAHRLHSSKCRDGWQRSEHCTNGENRDDLVHPEANWASLVVRSLPLASPAAPVWWRPSGRLRHQHHAPEQRSSPHRIEHFVHLLKGTRFGMAMDLTLSRQSQCVA